MNRSDENIFYPTNHKVGNKVSPFLACLLVLITNLIWAQELDDVNKKSRPVYIGVSIPFQGVGFYKVQDDKVLVWNITPLSFELPINQKLGIRFSAYTVFSTPKPKRIQEFELNFEMPHYFKGKKKPSGLYGFYLGPVIMLQINDQDSGANLGGPGITLGYRAQFNSKLWYRTGVFAAYHRYLWGPKVNLHKITNGSNSAGLFIGLTLLEVGMKF
jgi:hypothetical protein